MSFLVTLNDAKARLDLPSSDTSEDVSIQSALDAAESYLARRCRYDLAGVSSKVDTFTRVQLGDELTLTYRPVSSITSSVGRLFGGTTETTLNVDLISSNEGVIILTPDAGTLFPPQSPPAPWFSWRESEYSIVTITYAVTQTVIGTADPAFLDAVKDLAAYWHRRGLSVHLEAVVLSNAFREEYIEKSVPAWVLTKVSHLIRSSYASVI
jgi:hypothetical protein